MIPALLLAAAAAMPLGVAEGRCRADEPGPALLITVEGLKDRRGALRAELYPARDGDFLADDSVLLRQGKSFRRAVEPVPASGTVRICLRAPAPGTYALAVIHDRQDGGAFSLLHDGIGFAGNPRLGMAKPKAAEAAITVGEGLTPTAVVMNYRRGLFSFGPIGR
ncbi:DUF2141 domain-containing protein [Sphingomonas morindae]|uniref:DUF2141 domain-containing protein n=1 Tax=Sphingomonas morindae TaxID=1541170 RepID=A0ABY4X5A4_9SPHN|nr:DUF2141 domain-containing protein [Sphingomonas morindae]USI72061.1 DUF2141 domain-containing protein [Sphingomonas morindae]